LVRRVTQKTTLADAAALFVALNPFYWDFSHQVMAEVPTIAWAFFALLLCDRTFAQRSPAYSETVLVALVSGAGMLIKGTLLGLAFVPLAYWFSPRPMRAGWTRKLVTATLFTSGFSVPFLLWAIRNASIQTTGFDGVNQ